MLGCSKAKRIEYLKKLFSIYGKEYSHEVQDEAKGSLEEYNVTISYPAKLNCTEGELITEFNSFWPSLTKSWLKFKDSLPKPTVTKRFLKHVVEEFAVEYPNCCELIMVLKAISSGTGPVERSFTKLTKICYKDRSGLSSEVLEVLYLLTTLKIKGNEELWKNARKVLQK